MGLLALLLSGTAVMAQGVTTAALTGVVSDDNGMPLEGATVIALHQSSGTRYGTLTRTDGGFTLPAVRIGGPYLLTVSYVGYEKAEQGEIQLSLGETFRVDITLTQGTMSTDEVEITSTRGNINQGAATNVGNELIVVLPTLSRQINDPSDAAGQWLQLWGTRQPLQQHHCRWIGVQQ